MAGRDPSKRLELLREVASKGERLLIIIYKNPDPDALGSAVALRHLLGKNRDNCTICYSGEVGRLENAAMIELLKIPAVPFNAKMPRDHDIFATLDAQPPFFVGDEVINSIRFNIVIDHHAREKGYSADFEDIRPSYGSTSTIMTEYIRQSKKKMTTAVATALYYGLETDTGSLQRVATKADIAAFRYLRSRVNMNLMRKIQQSHLPLHALDYFGTAIIKKHVVSDIIFSHIGMVEFSDICVQVADFFMGVYKIGWSIVSGLVDDNLVVVFRSDGYKKNAGRLATAVFSGLGSAGGHKTMATVSYTHLTLPTN